jgi:O-antigen ligase
MYSILLVAAIMSATSVGLYIVNPELHRIAGYMSYGAGETVDIEGGLNEWGAFFALALAIIFWHIYREALTKWQLVLLVIISFGLLLDQSRSAYLAVAMMMAILFVSHFRRNGLQAFRLKSATIMLSLLVPIVLVVFASEKLKVDRITDSFVSGSNAQESIEDRLYLWPKSMELATANPLRFLVGYGNRSFAQLINSPTADNFYLDHWVSEGFLGLLLILGILSAPFWRLKGGRNMHEPRLLVVLAILIALVVSVTGNVLVDPTYGGVTFALLYGVSAVFSPSPYASII